MIGVAALALGALGVVIPGLPTTPFLLVALWAFRRGAPAWAERLRRHPTFGARVQAWETRRAIPRPAKGLAIAGMAGSWAALAGIVQNVALAVGAGAVMALVLGYVITRPSA